MIFCQEEIRQKWVISKIHYIRSMNRLSEVRGFALEQVGISEGLKHLKTVFTMKNVTFSPKARYRFFALGHLILCWVTIAEAI